MNNVKFLSVCFSRACLLGLQTDETNVILILAIDQLNEQILVL